MLDLTLQKRLVPWPEAKASILLSPLTISRRRELYQLATEMVDPKTGITATSETKGAKPAVNSRRFQDLVADECIHGWEGLQTAYSKDAARVLMNIEPANVFVFTTVQGLGIYMAEEVKTAGNA